MIKLSVPAPMFWPEFCAALERAPCGLPAVFAHVARRMNLHCGQIGQLASIAPEDRAQLLAEIRALPPRPPENLGEFQGQGSLTDIDTGLPDLRVYGHPDTPASQRKEIERRIAEVKGHERKVFGNKSEEWWR